MKANSTKVIGLLSLTVAGVGFLVACGFVADTLNFKRVALSAEGTVVELVRSW